MWLAKSFLLFCSSLSVPWYASPPPHSMAHFHIKKIFLKRKEILHLLTSHSNSVPPSLPLSSPQDGHLIHLTSWKDKYSSVECEAPASPAHTDRRRGESLPLSWAQTAKVLIKSSTQPDTDTRMATKRLTPQHSSSLYLKNRKNRVSQLNGWSHMRYFFKRFMAHLSWFNWS